MVLLCKQLSHLVVWTSYSRLALGGLAEVSRCADNLVTHTGDAA